MTNDWMDKGKASEGLEFGETHYDFLTINVSSSGDEVAFLSTLQLSITKASISIGISHTFE